MRDWDRKGTEQRSWKRRKKFMDLWRAGRRTQKSRGYVKVGETG